jgi:hypothetical protein
VCPFVECRRRRQRAELKQQTEKVAEMGSVTGAVIMVERKNVTLWIVLSVSVLASSHNL